ncbi:MAG: trypsin-like serine protease [Chloroflexota bacterium]
MNRIGKIFAVGLFMALLIGAGTAPYEPETHAQDGGTPSIFIPLVLDFSNAAAFQELTEDVPDQVQLDDTLTRDEMLDAEILQPEYDEDADDAAELSPTDDGDDDHDPTQADPLFDPGEFPDSESEALARNEFSDEWAALESDIAGFLEGTEEDTETEPESLAGDTSNGLYTRYYINGNRSFGTGSGFMWRTIGKLYFKVPGNSGWSSCTASVVGRRAVITAGHCVYTRGKGWHQDIRFYPGYQNGYIPFGEWRPSWIRTTNQWYNSSSLAHDYAVMVMQKRNGRNISYYTGYNGYMYGYSATQHWHSFGYPSNIGGGRWPIVCSAQTHRRDSRSGPDPIGIGCDQTYGASGGPWIVNYSPEYRSAKNYVFGVNSYIKVGKKTIYSPYFDSNAGNMIRWGRGFN